MQSSRRIPEFDDVADAARRIAGLVRHTPLLEDVELGRQIGGRVFCKCENLQLTGSFKFRGASNALSRLDPDRRQAGVIAVSSGNHGAAVAEAAARLNIPATVVMPSDAPAIKRRRTERSGATIVTYERDSDDREAIARKLAAERGLTLIHPYNDPIVIAGQGTAGLEIVDDLDADGVVPDQLVVPCSGGGLSAGIGLALKSRHPDAAIWAVEPEGFDDYRRSLAAGRIVANAAGATSIADALLVAAPGEIGFALNQRQFAGAVTVDDTAILAAMAHALLELKLVVEPGGAVALAALMSGAVDGRDRVSVVVLSGGNADPAMLGRALQSVTKAAP